MKRALFLSSLFFSTLLVSTTAVASVSDDQVTSQKIKEADGTSGQSTNSGSGVKTGHLQNASVTNAKIADGSVTDAKIAGPISASKISSSGLNADTVDGAHASAFAPASHSHEYGKVAIVAQSGGDYANPLEATADLGLWCGTPSSTNPCLIKIMPGVYDIGTATLAMSPYVDIEGSGEGVTKVTGSVTNPWGSVAAVLAGASNAEIRSITVENTGVAVGGFVVAVVCDGASPTLSSVTISVFSAYNTHSSFGLHVSNGASPTLKNATVLINGSGGAGGNNCYGISVNGSSATLLNTKVDVNALWYFEGYQATQSTSKIMGSLITGGSASRGTAVAIFEGSLAMTDTIVDTFRDGLGLGATTTPPQVTIERSTVQTQLPGMSQAIGGMGDVRIGNSRIGGPVINSGSTICVGSYSAEYAPLNSSCQP